MGDMYDIIRKYYVEGSELHEILVRHSEAVRDRALAIAARMPELGIDVRFVAEAALLHDIGIVRTDAAGIGCYGVHPYIMHGVLGAEMLRAEGLERHARVCERHTGSGLTVRDIVRGGLPLPHRDFLPETVEERLICYADKFYSKTHIGYEYPIETVRWKMAKKGREALERFEALNIMFNV